MSCPIIAVMIAAGFSAAFGVLVALAVFGAMDLSRPYVVRRPEDDG